MASLLRASRSHLLKTASRPFLAALGPVRHFAGAPEAVVDTNGVGVSGHGLEQVLDKQAATDVWRGHRWLWEFVRARDACSLIGAWQTNEDSYSWLDKTRPGTSVSCRGISPESVDYRVEGLYLVEEIRQ